MTQSPTTVDETVAQALVDLRRPLLGFCYRMLGSPYDAEDAVQETMIRAWRTVDRLDDLAGLRPWVYRIATNVCIDAVNGRRRRALPMDLTAPDDGRGALDMPLPESAWIAPIPSWKVDAHDPAERAEARESIRLAFVAALQHLLPGQRAVLILRDVLRWRAAEVAALLEISVDAVHSSLRRARAALARARLGDAPRPARTEQVDACLLQHYVDAFERFDIDAIVSLLHHDVVVSMPPYSFWLHGADAFRAWLPSQLAACGHIRVVTTTANGSPAAVIYSRQTGDVFKPGGLHVLDWHDGKIASMHAFLEPALVRVFDLPQVLRPEPAQPAV